MREKTIYIYGAVDESLWMKEKIWNGKKDNHFPQNELEFQKLHNAKQLEKLISYYILHISIQNFPFFIVRGRPDGR